MMSKATGIFVALVVCSLMSACGGGSGSTPSNDGTKVPPPVVSTASFQLKAALADDLGTSYRRAFTIAGTVVGEALTGSGEESTYGLAQGRVGSSDGFIKSIYRNWSWSSQNNASRRTGFDQTLLLDASNQLLIDTDRSSYLAYVNGVATLPETGKVNTSGSYFEAGLYTDGTKATQVGTRTGTYAVLPDTATTALLKITTVNRFNASGAETSESRILRITPSGVSTLVSTTIHESNGLDMTYTYQ